MIQNLQWETSIRHPKVLRCTRVLVLVYSACMIEEENAGEDGVYV